MENVHKEIIQSNLQQLFNDLEPDPLKRFLYEKGIFTREHVNIITSKNTREEKIQELLSILERSGPHAFSVFIEGLQKNKHWLAEMLLEEGQYKQGEWYLLGTVVPRL